MAEFDNKTREIVQRLQTIRVKMLREQPFYAVLLMHLRFALDESTPTLYTDGERIAFNPYFVDELDDFQLQFVLMHEILHVALRHCISEEKDFNHKAYNIACDIVVNSNIMYSLGLIKEKVDFWGNKTGYEVKKEVEIDGEPLIHKAPNGIEGVELDAKEVYALLLKAYPELAKEDEENQENFDKSNQGSSNKKGNKGKAQSGKMQGADGEAKSRSGNEGADGDSGGDSGGDNSDEANNKSNQSNKSNTNENKNPSDKEQADGDSGDEGPNGETDSDSADEGADGDSADEGADGETSDDNSDEANNKSNQSNKSNTNENKNPSDEGEANGDSGDEGEDGETNGDSGDEGADGSGDSGSVGDGDCSNMDGDTASNTASGGSAFAEGKLGELYDREKVGEGNSDPIYSNAPSNSKRFYEFDDHSFWDVSSDSDEEQVEENEIWTSRMVEATEIAEKISEEYLSIKDAHKGFGGPPLGAKRLLKEILEPQTDWRTVLENFIQEEVNDYSFSPPDRRFEDSPFFLPDFNEKDTFIKNIVFLIDTSGSISDSMIRRAYSEIKGAVDQLGNKFEGYIVFCDELTYDLQPFCEETDLSKIIPKGGGGNNFERNIRDVLEAMKDEPPECMIFITDGYDAFPDESVTNGIPFLWLITNTNVEPPWGKVARLTAED